VLLLLLAANAANAGLRGAYDPLTVDSDIPNGFEQPALRPEPSQDGIEHYFSFTTRSTVIGYETSRGIWLHVNRSRAGFGLSGDQLDAVRVALLHDPSARVSYVDPAWSPDGRFLAYVKTDRWISSASIYVQEYRLGATLAEAATPVGDPVLVVSGADGSHNRHPAWSPDGRTLAFDSDRSGAAIDIWTVDVFPSVGEPVQRTDDMIRAEMCPAWSPDGTRIAFHANTFGVFAIYIVDLTTPEPHAIVPLETRGQPSTSRRAPAWSSDGRSIYYESPANDIAENVNDIWKFDIATQERCAIYVDATADWDVDVSLHQRTTPEGTPYNYILFTSMGAASIWHIPNVWRAQYIQNCLPPLAIGIDLQPSSLQIGGSGQDIVATLRFPPETKARGYQCQSYDGPAEGVRMRVTIIPSPTLVGLAARGDRSDMRQFGETAFPLYRDYIAGGDPRIDVRFPRAAVESVLVAQGALNRQVLLEVRAYSNGVGRQFLGYGLLKISTSGLAAGGPETRGRDREPALVAAPNPFNPSTTIRFRLAEPGDASVCVYDVHGARVRTLARQRFPEGTHEARWDGRDDDGATVATGIYFVRVETPGAAPERLKLILLK
jgi:Tol biopolymer transport system component